MARLEYNPGLYNAKFYASRRKDHKYHQRYAQPIIDLLGPFGSILDLGAGDGHFARVLGGPRAEVHVVELSEAVLPYVPQGVHCLIHDLREPLDMARTFDLVVCIEVAEHLPESAADILCDTIVGHMGRYLLFTAAPPGQGGNGHINCQPPGYWKQKFGDRGLGYRKNPVKRLRVAWGKVLKAQHRHLARNVQIWEK